MADSYEYQDFGPFTMEEVKEAFHSFDLDGNKYIGAGEVRKMFKSICILTSTYLPTPPIAKAYLQ